MAALIARHEQEQQEMQSHRHGMLKNLGEVRIRKTQMLGWDD